MFWFWFTVGGIISLFVLPLNIPKALLTLALCFVVGLGLDCLVCLVTWYEHGNGWQGWRDFFSYWKRPREG